MNKHDIRRDACMLTGSFARRGYDWWWHSFTAIDDETGQEQPFFIEFYICNPARGTDEPVLGQLPENKLRGILPSYLMIKAGTWGEHPCQLHRFFGVHEMALHAQAPFSITAGDCFLSETATHGSVTVAGAEDHPEWMCDNGEMSWDLTIDKQIPFNVGYGASKPLRDVKAFEMYWHAEGMKTLYSGTIRLNGRSYTARPETSFGYADKNWGRGFTSPWVWLSSCCLTSRITGQRLENTVFDIGGGKPKVYFLPLDRKLLGAIVYEGTHYEFNFSKFWTHSRTEFDSGETQDQITWHIRQETRDAVLIIDAACDKREMLLVNYEAPDGSKRHNHLWNGGNGRGRVQLFRKEGGQTILIDDMDAVNIGCEYGEYDS